MHLCAQARTRYGSRFYLSPRVASPLACLQIKLTTCPLQSADGRVTQGYYITAYRNLTSVSPLTNSNHPGDGRRSTERFSNLYSQ